MKVEVEEKSDVSVAVSIELSAEQVDDALKKQYKDLAKTVVLPGFRKGKAPRGLLAARFGKEIALETARNLIGETLFEALSEADVAPLGQPEIDNDPLVAGEPLRYTVRCEVAPRFDPEGYRDLELPPLEVTVEDAEVQDHLGRMQRRAAQLVPEDEGAKADTGSVLTIDYKGTVDGKEFAGGSAEAATIELGAGSMLPGFEHALMGVAADETREFDVEIPPGYPIDGPDGHPAHFAVTVTDIRRKELPALDDEFAKDQGAESLAALTDILRTQMTDFCRSSEREKQRKALITQLLEKNPFDVPPQLLEKEVERRKLPRQRAVA